MVNVVGFPTRPYWVTLESPTGIKAGGVFHSTTPAGARAAAVRHFNSHIPHHHHGPWKAMTVHEQKPREP